MKKLSFLLLLMPFLCNAQTHTLTPYLNSFSIDGRFFPLNTVVLNTRPDLVSVELDYATVFPGYLNYNYTGTVIVNATNYSNYINGSTGTAFANVDSMITFYQKYMVGEYGSDTLSAAQISWYQDQDALMDPNAYVLYNGTGWSFTVPAGETWYEVSSYNVSPVGAVAQLHHRDADIAEAVPLTSGTTITPASNSYMYICRPNLVIPNDSRYTTDPRLLYYTRIQKLKSIPITYMYLNLPSTMATGTTASLHFPSGFSSGMVQDVIVYECSWGGLTDTLGAGTINTQNEINNFHSVRFSHSNGHYPFLTSTMTGIEAAAGNDSGLAATHSVGGSFAIGYQVLPIGFLKENPIYVDDLGQEFYFENPKNNYRWHQKEKR